MLRTENSVEQPLRAECGGKERFELTGQDPWYVAQTLRHRENWLSCSSTLSRGFGRRFGTRDS